MYIGIIIEKINDNVVKVFIESEDLESRSIELSQFKNNPSDYEDLKSQIPEFVEYLDSVAKGTNYRALTLFITDVFEKKSYCLYNTSASDVVKNSFKLEEVYQGVMLDGVVSRKAQIAPYIMDAIEK